MTDSTGGELVARAQEHPSRSSLSVSNKRGNVQSRKNWFARLGEQRDLPDRRVSISADRTNTLSNLSCQKSTCQRDKIKGES